MYLNNHTYYSLRYGTLSPQELVEQAVAYGLTRVVLTDINNTSALFEFHKACREGGVTPIAGIEFRQDDQIRYIGIARNEEGFRELTTLLTRHLMEGQTIPRIAPEWKHAVAIYTALPKPIESFQSHEYYGIRPQDVNALYSSPLRRHADRLVALAPVTFHRDDGHRIHKLLRCIDENIVIGQLRDYPIAGEEEYMRPVEELKQLYAPYPRIVKNTEALLAECEFEMRLGVDNNRRYFTENRAEDMALLTKLAHRGCKQRYPSDPRATKRVEKELAVIDQLGFATYFLITWDIVRYAQSVGYYHIGRGSGANSIVAFCLFITDVDPLELDLYFERFINPYRTSPPDFDIDFSWNERDDVTDYIFKRYGKERTALLATYNTFKGRSIVRELGKVFGLPKADIDLLVQEPMATEKHHAYAKHIFYYGKKIEGLPNHLSIHAGGIVISERPLSYHTALQMMPKGFPIVQFDMYAAEDIGFYKYDILSQRGLGHIRDAVDYIRENRNESVNVHDVARIKKDQRVIARLRSGNCIGCFYIESPAMRGLLHKLHCDNYVALIAASSIIRPGVAKSGMMREYIQRAHHPESFHYLHETYETHLKETYGVMVYQEDVMKIVHHFAGLDLDESDILRRIMTGKKKSSDTFRNLQAKFFHNSRERGHDPKLTQEVWRQVESFSGYSFCKAHSASFAVESFQSLYLKTYYPLEFMVAVINNFGGFYSTELYVHEARMAGGNIEPPCINHSRYLTHLEGEDIYIGFVHIRDLERKVVTSILEEREHNGAFRSFSDFLHRVHLPKIQLDLLIRIGAFRFTGLNKYELMWEKNAFRTTDRAVSGVGDLFESERETFTLPRFEVVPHEQAFDEIELLGFPLSSPFELVNKAEVPDRVLKQECPAQDLIAREGQAVTMLGYYVCRKHVTTVNGKHMNFGTWVDRAGHFFDTVHFPPALARSPFKGKGMYAIHGKVVLDFGFPSVEVSRMEKVPYVSDERY